MNAATESSVGVAPSQVSSQQPLVYVTGASSGIGQALAACYYAQGWRVALVARRCESIEAWVRERGFDATRVGVYAADVRDTASIIAAGERCLQQQGLPTVVIANAGISVGVDSAEREDIDVLTDVFATNCIGMAATFHPFIKPMRKARRGTLVGIGSVSGVRGIPWHGAYCASKAAVATYCESLRGEMRSFGVRVVTIVPGYVATPLTSHNTYAMPFQLQPEEFARRAARAIESGTSYRVIPWQMGVVAKIMRMLPNALYDFLVRGRGRKKRRSEMTGG